MHCFSTHNMKYQFIYSMKCIIISYIVWNFKWSLTYSMKCIAISCEGTKILCQMEAFKLPNPIHRIKNNFHFSKAQKKRRNRQKYKTIIQSLIHTYLSLYPSIIVTQKEKWYLRLNSNPDSASDSLCAIHLDFPGLPKRVKILRLQILFKGMLWNLKVPQFSLIAHTKSLVASQYNRTVLVSETVIPWFWQLNVNMLFYFIQFVWFLWKV